jgi:hypothetical protein
MTKDQTESYWQKLKKLPLTDPLTAVGINRTILLVTFLLGLYFFNLINERIDSWTKICFCSAIAALIRTYIASKWLKIAEKEQGKIGS